MEGTRVVMRELKTKRITGVQQRWNFIQQNIQGRPISEVFIRFPGRTNWKFLGEISSRYNDFETAVQVQWTTILDKARRLHPKTRMWLPTDIPVQLGYADENAEIRIVKGPLPEGMMPFKVRALSRNCGFVATDKE